MNENPAMVLTYHEISEGGGPLRVSPSSFEKQLDLLAGAGFEAVTLGSLLESLERDLPLPRASFALTFDDAYRDFSETALPILERRSLRATLFTTASAHRETLPGGTGAPLLALEELEFLARRGVEIGAHSVSHVDLTGLDDDALAHELRDCREILESHLGRPVEHFAYPFGRFDARVRTAVEKVFRSGCTTQLAQLGRGTDPLAIPRVDACYLHSPLLRWLLARGRPEPYLRLRRRLRRLRGSEPRASGPLRERTQPRRKRSRYEASPSPRPYPRGSKLEPGTCP